MASYEVRVSREQNRLYMTLEGMLDVEQANAVVDQVEDAMDVLEPGFDVINDISAFKPVSQEATAAIERGKQVIGDHDVNAVVRVTGESVIGKMQFDRVGSEREGYHVATAETSEAAAELLDRFAEADAD